MTLSDLRALLLVAIATPTVLTAADEDVKPPPRPPLLLVDLPPPPAPIPLDDLFNDLPLPPPPAPALDIPLAPIERQVIRAAPSQETGLGADGTYGGFNDLRVAWVGGASAFTLTYDDQFFNSITETGTYDSGARVSIEWVGSPGLSRGGGWLLGVMGAFQTNTGETDTGGTVELTLWTLDLQLGYAVPIGRSIQVELLPFAGLGGIEGTITGPNGDEQPGGFVFDYGVRVNALYTFDGGFQIGLSGGWIGYNGTLEDSRYTNATSFSITADGFVGGVMLGYRM
jgi:hypothetical protein